MREGWERGTRLQRGGLHGNPCIVSMETQGVVLAANIDLISEFYKGHFGSVTLKSFPTLFLCEKGFNLYICAHIYNFFYNLYVMLTKQGLQEICMDARSKLCIGGKHLVLSCTLLPVSEKHIN